MAFPVVESTAKTERAVTETTTPVTFPATISPGALIVCIARCTVAGAIGWPASWVELVEDSSDASDDVSAIAYFTAVGNEDGTTFNVTHGSGKSAYIVYSITGAEAPATQPPQISTVATGTSASPNPAALTPTGGAKDYTWLWLGAWEGEQASPPASTPTNYHTSVGAFTGTGGVVATNCRVASAQRQLNAASEDPPLWTISVSDDWSAWTMAVHPVSPQVTLAATPAGVATVTPALAVNLVLAAAPAGIAEVTAVMAVSLVLAAAPAGVSTVDGAVAVDRGLAAVPAGVSTVDAALTVTLGGVTLAAEPAGVATLTVALQIDRGLAAASAGVSTVDGAMAVARPLAATSGGVAAVTAVAALTLGLAAQSGGAAAVSPALDVITNLAATVAGSTRSEVKLMVSRYFVTWDALKLLLDTANSPFKNADDGSGRRMDFNKFWD